MGGSNETTESTGYTLPQEQQDMLSGLYSYAGNLLSNGVQPYTGPMTAGSSPLSGEAADIYRKMAEDPNVAGRTAENFATMKEAVLDPQVAAMARQFAQQEVGNQGDLIRAGAFGGSRRDIYEGERAGAYQGNVANLMAQGYSQAQASALAQVGAEQAALGSAASGLGGLGAAETQLALQNLQMPYQQYLFQQQYPLSVLQGAAGLPYGYQYGGSSTVTQSEPYDWLGAAASVGQAFPFL
jgi:hypothetical protein